MTVAAPHIVFEMVFDATAGTHAAARNNDRPRANAIDGHRLRRCAQKMEIGQHRQLAVTVEQGFGLGVEQVAVSQIDFGRFERERAVEENMPAREILCVKELANSGQLPLLGSTTAPSNPGLDFTSVGNQSLVTVKHGPRHDSAVRYAIRV